MDRLYRLVNVEQARPPAILRAPKVGMHGASPEVDVAFATPIFDTLV
jgi:hypothetical protein